MSKLKIKRGDNVVVITGKDKGKKGEVVKVLPQEMKVIVSGVNQAIKHQKPSRANPQGGKIKIDMPIHYSNVSVLDPKLDIATRVGYKVLESGEKVRVSRRSNEIIDNNSK